MNEETNPTDETNPTNLGEALQYVMNQALEEQPDLTSGYVISLKMKLVEPCNQMAIQVSHGVRCTYDNHIRHFPDVIEFLKHQIESKDDLVMAFEPLAKRAVSLANAALFTKAVAIELSKKIGPIVEETIQEAITKTLIDAGCDNFSALFMQDPE